MTAAFAARICGTLAGAALAAALPAAAGAQGTPAPYPSAVRATPGLEAYWRLGDATGTVAAEATGRAPGTYAGAPQLGARGALSADADTAVRFDGVDDELQAPGAAIGPQGTVEGWFFWESGVALMRDATSAGGWILAFDSAGRVAYRVAGTTFVTPLATAGLRDGWHHVALTVAAGATTFYVDGTRVHAAPGAGSAPAAMPWHVMRNGATTGQYTRGRADEVAVYGSALDEATVRAHFLAGRDIGDTAAPAAPAGLVAAARLGRVELEWSDSPEPDLDGYDVFRATSAAGPFARVNPARLSRSAYADTSVTGGTQYFYAVTASDVANNRSPLSAQATATPPSTDALLERFAPQLRYETQETYFADSAAEMTDNFVPGSRQNHLVSGDTRVAAANPADPLADLSLGFLGEPAYADGRPAAPSDFLDAANGTYQQDAQRMRAAGYGDRVYGRVVSSGGRIWLQYWLFSYFNPQNVLGFGVHEGDWESIQVGLDADGAPEVATYAQHDDGERCPWGQVQRTAGGAPVVYVALASHASYFSPGVNPRGLLPDDHHRGGGYRVRPALERVGPSTSFLAWRGRWGGSSTSPVAPRRQGKWGDPAGFNAGAGSCTVGGTQAFATEAAQDIAAEVPEPRISVTRAGGRAVVRYRFPPLGGDPQVRPTTLLLSVSQAGAADEATARRVRVRRREGTASLRLPSGAGLRHVVTASAFSAHGARSRTVRASLR